MTRSHLADGSVLIWSGVDPLGHAIDAEITGQPVPPALARRTGITDPGQFWRRWTAMEVACKLFDVPAHLWLKQHGLSVDHVRAELEMATFIRDGVTISLGRRCDWSHRGDLTGAGEVLMVRAGDGPTTVAELT